MLDNFYDKIDDVVNVLEDVKKLADELNYNYAIRRSEALVQRLRDMEFHVIVIGEFKRGKSTLLNYFIGEELLPTGVIPITALVTKIKYSDEARAEIRFTDGSIKEIDIADISEYISEQENPKNIKGVDFIDVFTSSKFLKGGIVLIDTPGIGSIHRHNTEVAYNYLSEADAAIFLISSDAPIGEAEQKYLNEVKKHIEKIFFVQNKADYLTENELQESMIFSKGAIEDIIKKEPKIYPISAKLAIEAQKSNNQRKMRESRITLFESALENFFLEEKATSLIKSTVKKLKAPLTK